MINASLEPVNLTELLISIITITGSFLLAYFTSKREMKRMVFERRMEIYLRLDDFLRRLKKERHYRESPESVRDLLQIESEVKILGSVSLVRSVTGLRRELEECQEQAAWVQAQNLEQSQNERYYYEEQGFSREEIDELAHKDEQLFENRALTYEFELTNNQIDLRTAEMIDDMRSTLHVKSFRPGEWFKKTRFCKRISLWK